MHTAADAHVMGPRGERASAGRFVAPLAVVALVLAVVAVGAAVALLPQRVERPVSARLRAVRIANALGARCQIENGTAAPLPYSCGANEADLHRSADASPRRLVALRSAHDNCVIDEDTLEAVLCRDTMIEWASIDGPVVNLAVIDTRGGHYEIAQRHLETGERRTIALSFSHYFDWHDPARVTVRTASTHERIGFGVLWPLPLTP